MKIEFLTQDDPLYILPFFEEFVCSYGDDFEIVRVSSMRTMGKRSRGKLIGEMLQLYGGWGFLKLGSRLAISRFLGKLPRNSRARRYHTMSQLFRARGVPYGHVDNPNEPAFVDHVKQRNADVLVSVACPAILKEPLLNTPRLGCVNIHHAPLPRYKGMMPTFWQLYHGEKTVGVTVHYMAPKVDEGAALLQESIPVNPGESLDTLIRRSKRHGAHCVARVLHLLSAGDARAIALDNSKGTYFTFPTAAEMRQFHKKGLRAI